MKQQLSEIWHKVLILLQEELDEQTYQTWINAARPIAYHDGTLVISTLNEFTRDWWETRFSPLIRSYLESILNRSITLRFVTPDGMKNFLLESEHTAEFSPRLNPKYTFDTFVIGDSNRLAHAASLAVAEQPSKAYNPLFIYGGSGLGKTHLMHAIGNFVIKNNDQMKVVYATSETFTNELIASIREDNSLEFRNKYRTIDILLIDDVQFLINKERTQEEFFHTFNALYESSKQIVLTSDRPPREIPTLEDRLRSRFEWGLIADINQPDFETRMAILQKKAQLENISLPSDVVAFIATNVKSNIRELEGALSRVIAYGSLNHRQINLDLASEALKDILAVSSPKIITINEIQKTVAQYFNLKIDDLKARRRTKIVAYPRQIAMYLSRELTEASLPNIGKEFGGRDHTTVLHACDKIKEDMERDPHLVAALQEIAKKLRR